MAPVMFRSLKGQSVSPRNCRCGNDECPMPKCAATVMLLDLLRIRTLPKFNFVTLSAMVGET